MLDGDRVASLFEQMNRQFLVHLIILGQEDAERPLFFPQRVAGDQGRPLDLRFRSHNPQDGVQKLRLADRFGQVSGDAQLPAARRIAPLPGRGQHDDSGVG